MRKKSLFGKKFKLKYALSAMFCCTVLLCYVPILGSTFGMETTYCEVLLDGEVIGAVSDPVIGQGISRRPRYDCPGDTKACTCKCGL